MASGKKEVIVRGFTAHWMKDNFKDMKIYFGGSPPGIPKDDTSFIGFYLEAPDSAITHIGVVEYIERYDSGKTYHLKAIIKLDAPIKVEHPIRKHEYWSFEDLGVEKLALIFNSFSTVGKARS